jgi:hypothetical protein
MATDRRPARRRRLVALGEIAGPAAESARCT